MSGPFYIPTKVPWRQPVFAFIVLRLVDRGVIDLDKPLYTYRFTYNRIDKDPRSKLITARMVLDHTAGLPNWGGTPLEFLFTPGEKFNYSGEGYVYLQGVVEHLTGKSLEDLAQQEVFVPVKMEHSTFRWRPILANQPQNRPKLDLLCPGTRVMNVITAADAVGKRTNTCICQF